MPEHDPDTRVEPEAIGLLRLSLTEIAGAAIVLDAQLRVVERTDEAERLVGTEVRAGVSAPRLLCGLGQERPLAEALAEGRAASATVERVTPEGSQLIRVRAVPLSADGTRNGWLLLLTREDSGEGSEGALDEHGIGTRDPGMKRLLHDARKVARSEVPVLVRGETGSGKELLARFIHEESSRAAGPFRAINCAALPAALLESELFGHVRGAFTGAVRDAPGHLRLADRGTLFLDEVADLPLELQGKLLRALEAKEVTPVGGSESVSVDVRFVAATNKALRREVDARRFRADLMYRLRVVPLFLPPLRERIRDVELLAWRFIEDQNKSGPRQVMRVTPGALRLLEAYDWPGNVRELRNAVQYAFVMGEGPVLGEADLPPELSGEEGRRAARTNVSPEAVLDLPNEARRIVRALERAGGNRERAAQSLGMSRVTLWRKIKAYQLDQTLAPRADKSRAAE